jgi:hypothetical protein
MFSFDNGDEYDRVAHDINVVKRDPPANAAAAISTLKEVP